MYNTTYLIIAETNGLDYNIYYCVDNPDVQPQAIINISPLEKCSQVLRSLSSLNISMTSLTN